MATTSSTLVAGKGAAAGQGGNGKRLGRRTAGLVIIAALGLALVAGFLFMQGRHAAQQTARQASVNPVAIDAHVAPTTRTTYEQQRFLEVNLQLPASVAPTTGTTIERQRFLEANLWFPTSVATATGTTYEQQRFLEANLWFPVSIAPTMLPPADQFNRR